jgi:O-glycosyl hydrolase
MNNNLKLRSIVLLSICFIWSCNKHSNNNSTLIIDIDTNNTFQTIEHFGASDAWSCQFVGNWPSEKKNAIADLLFSKDMNGNGKPIGIGLSIWRFNIGAGSTEQGDLSGIKDEWRRAESFLEANGTYNWKKQQGQVWFAQAAKVRGVDKLLVFPNSPPVSMTKNGKAYADNGQTNLDSNQFNNYANYLTTVIKGLQNMELNVNYISPVNEPQWNWDEGTQEGSPFWNNEIAEITRKLNHSLDTKKLSTLIDIAEAGKLTYLYGDYDKPGKGRQVLDFFIQSSENYIADLSHYGKSISGHSYFTTSPFALSTSVRKNLSQSISEIPNLNFWMSEYCILVGNEGDIIGEGRDLGINPALYIAKVIHNDLAIAQATAWHWWTAVSPYDYKDGLIYIDYNKENGEYYESKMLWALGNYSRFIRPGYKRITMKSNLDELPNENFLFSGYKNPDTNELVLVMVNSGVNDTKIDLQSPNHLMKNKKAYITSSDKNLEIYNLEDSNTITIPSRSIMTIILQNQ